MLLTIKEILIGLKVTCIATLFIIVYETILKFDFGTKKTIKDWKDTESLDSLSKLRHEVNLTCDIAKKLL